jgi:hypothetical protein
MPVSSRRRYYATPGTASLVAEGGLIFRSAAAPTAS